ncbi:hypothetical protein MTO96_019873 [Rhipicephalus appendiculatus]
MSAVSGKLPKSSVLTGLYFHRVVTGTKKIPGHTNTCAGIGPSAYPSPWLCEPRGGRGTNTERAVRTGGRPGPSTWQSQGPSDDSLISSALKLARVSGKEGSTQLVQPRPTAAVATARDAHSSCRRRERQGFVMGAEEDRTTKNRARGAGSESRGTGKARACARSTSHLDLQPATCPAGISSSSRLARWRVGRGLAPRWQYTEGLLQRKREEWHAERERVQRAPPKSHGGGHRAARQVQAAARHVFFSGGSTGPAVNGCESSPPSTQLPPLLRTPDVASVPLAAF